MIPALFMMWCMAAPMGFLVGDVFAHKNQLTDPEYKRALPFLCAVFTPLAAVLAIVVLLQAEITKENEDV